MVYSARSEAETPSSLAPYERFGFEGTEVMPVYGLSIPG